MSQSWAAGRVICWFCRCCCNKGIVSIKREEWFWNQERKELLSATEGRRGQYHGTGQGMTKCSLPWAHNWIVICGVEVLFWDRIHMCPIQAGLQSYSAGTGRVKEQSKSYKQYGFGIFDYHCLKGRLKIDHHSEFKKAEKRNWYIVIILHLLEI